MFNPLQFTTMWMSIAGGHLRQAGKEKDAIPALMHLFIGCMFVLGILGPALVLDLIIMLPLTLLFGTGEKRRD